MPSPFWPLKPHPLVPAIETLFGGGALTGFQPVRPAPADASIRSDTGSHCRLTPARTRQSTQPRPARDALRFGPLDVAPAKK